jgi:MarR family transcriptional regulator, organic hydroperoxide resistance regulator
MIGTLIIVRSATGAPATENPLALQEQVCFALAVASRSVVAVYKPILEPLGLTHPQYLVMLALWEHEPVSVRELSRLLQLDPATLSPLLKRLESAGYLRRKRNEHDERALAVELTPTGRALRRRALDVPPAVVERLGLDLDELTQLQRRLTRVIEAATTPPA